ncbi:MAG: choice-of-anchor D domain-containing protein [Candidatus Latescibacterota bacterium]|nr:MAG: choice-of-anchor D domain-containing protein [Candidatus Latescibacterota bacterium]
MDPPEQIASDSVEVGYRDHDFGARVYSSPTAEKPESKLWWNDDSWWGCLWDAVADAYRIHRLDVATQSWISVGPNVDNRSDTIVDVLWDGIYLYILSHEHEGSDPAMLWSYTYSSGTGTYTLRSGFPVTVNSDGPEAATIAKDTTGKLWVTWESGGDIMVSCTTASDLVWGPPFRLPVQGADASSDDISAVTSFAGRIGILWSNQNDQKVYFAVHVDGQADTSWEPREVALADSGLAVADDHLNFAVDGDNVYAVTKTSLSLLSDPGIYLIRRDAAGNWTRYVVALDDDDYTRPCVLVDDENDKIHVFALCTSGSDAIRMKTSDLNSINFPPGLGELVIQSDEDRNVNNPTSTKQNVNGRTDLLVIASDHRSDRYLHNYIDLPGGFGDVAVTPASHDYGDVVVGASETQTFEVRNEGPMDLNVTSTTLVGVDATAFVIDSGGGVFTLAPGATRNLVVRFNATSLGARSAALRIESDDPDESPLDVALSGVGVEQDIAVTPGAQDYGDLRVGQSATHTFEVRNEGTSFLVVTSTAIVGADSTQFAVDSGGGSFPLSPGVTRDIVVSFNPSIPGAKTAALRIESTDPDENPLDVPLSGVGVEPDITVAPPTHDYAGVVLGDSVAQTFEVRNDGTSDLSVTSTALVGADSTQFSIDSGGGAFVLVPGATRDLVVRFAPAALGAMSAALRIASDDPDESSTDVALSGTGVEPDISVTPSTYDYANVLLGQSTAQTFEVRNDGTSDLSVTSTALVGADSTHFAIDSGGGAFVLVPGGTRDVVVRFAPTALGAKSAVLRIASDDPDEGSVDVPLSGVGVEPDITVVPATHDYGDVLVGRTTAWTFEVRNEGNGDLSVALTSLVGVDSTQFAIDSGGGAFVLTPGGTRDVVVGFNPAALGAKSAALRITSDDPDEGSFDVPLSGVGIEPDIAVVPATYDYGNVFVGQDTTWTFEVRNEGTGDLDVTSTTLAGADSTQFAIDSGGGAFLLAPGGTRDVVVRFNPTSPGTKSAALRIASNDPDTGLLDVPLSGIGLAPDIAVVPSTHDYGGVVVGQSAAHTLQVRNDGNVDLSVSSTTLVGADSTAFAIDSGGGAFILVPGGTRDLVVSFSPESLGVRSSTLQIASDDPDTALLDVALSGTGLAPDISLTPSTHDYGNVVVGQSAAQVFRVRNDGTADLNVMSTTLVGVDSTAFAIDAGGGAFVLAPGGTRDLLVSFLPDTSSARSAALRIASDDPDSATLDAALSGVGVEPDIGVTPSAHDYGDVWVGQSAAQTFEIRNDGSANLQVTSTTIVGADSTAFAIESGGGVVLVAPDSTHDVVVRFSPASAGAKSAVLRISSDDPDEDPADVALSGTGREPDIALTPVAHDYGEIRVGQSGTQTFQVRNDGNADLSVTSTTLVGTDSIAFAIDSGGGAFLLGPGGTRDLVLSFNPTSSGSRSAALRVTSDDPDSGILDVALAGVGVEPDIVVAPAAHDYGDVVVGQSATQTFQVSNDGSADLNVTSTTLVGTDSTAFAIDSGGGSFVLVPDSTRAVVVRFDPDSLGARSATLRIVSDDPDTGSMDVPLSGLGVEPDIEVTPAAYDYGDVVRGQSATQTFQVRNDGTSDLDVTSTTVFGADSTAFAVESGGAPFTLASGVSRDVSVRFAPDSLGAAGATLRIVSDDPDEGAVDVALSGVGVEPDVAVTPATHDYGDVVLGESATQVFEVRNDGTTVLDVTSTTLVGADSTLFTIESGGGSFSLAPGSSQDLVVRFDASTLDAKSATLRLGSNDPDENPLDAALAANVVRPPEPEIGVTPVAHDYGDVPVGQSAPQVFDVRNDGASDLHVTSTTLVGADSTEFAIQSGGGAFTLAPGAVQAIEVHFDPASPGAKGTALRLVSDDPDENPLDVSLSGAGVEPDIEVTPATHDYGDVVRGQSATQTFQVRNDGTSDLDVTSTTFVGADSTLFTLDSGGGAFIVAPGDSHAVVVRFTPDSLGARSAALRIASDDPDAGIVDVSLSGTGVEPDIAVTPATHDYGSLLVGQSALHTFQVQNTGTSDLEVTSTTLVGADSTAFAIDSGGGAFSLVPGDTHAIAVRFDPMTLGAASTALRIASSDPDEPSLDVPLSGAGIGPAMSVVPAAHDYGDLRVGASATQAIQVRNEGTTDLSVASTRLVGADSTQFTIDAGGGAFIVAPGDSHAVVVRFAPDSLGARSAALRIASDDPNNPLFDVALSGTGVEPDIAVAPAFHDYGDVVVSQSVTHSFALRNEGSADLSVTSTTFAGADSTQFTIDAGGGAFIVAPGDSHSVVVRFTPDSLGARSAALRIASDDPDSGILDVALSGRGVQPDIAVTPVTHDYGVVYLGQSATQTFQVQNTGTSDLDVTSTTLVGADSTEFVIDLGGGSILLPPGGAHDVLVRFAPSSVGPKSATLQFVSNDPDQNPLNVALTGSGDVAPEPEIVVTPASHDYRAVVLQWNASQTFQVRNDGTASLDILSTTLVGDDEAAFRVTSGAGALTLPPGVSHFIVVRFTPTLAGSKSATLRISSSDPDDDPVDIALAGTGVSSLSRSGKYSLEEISTGRAARSSSVSTASDVLRVEGERYLAAVVLDGSSPVAKVSGMGLSWTLLQQESAGAGGARVEVWVGAGVPAPGRVTATFHETASNALIAVVGDAGGDRSAGAAEEARAETDRHRGADRVGEDAGSAPPQTPDTDDDFLELAERALSQAVRADAGPPSQQNADPPSQRNADPPREVELEINAQHDGIHSIEVSTPATTRVRVTVHDVRGRLVRALWSDTMTAGRQRLEWNTDNPRTGSGIYFIRAEIGTRVLTQKLVLVR